MREKMGKICKRGDLGLQMDLTARTRKEVGYFKAGLLDDRLEPSKLS